LPTSPSMPRCLASWISRVVKPVPFPVATRCADPWAGQEDYPGTELSEYI
jgi:hypothetical protein